MSYRREASSTPGAADALCQDVFVIWNGDHDRPPRNASGLGQRLSVNVRLEMLKNFREHYNVECLISKGKSVGRAEDCCRTYVNERCRSNIYARRCLLSTSDAADEEDS